MDSFHQPPGKPIKTEHKSVPRRLGWGFFPMYPSELAELIYSTEATMAAKTTSWRDLDGAERSFRTRVADAVLKELYKQLDEQQS